MTAGQTAPTPCSGCRGEKRAGQYLCSGCWFRLAPGVQKALYRKDTKASLRLIQLHRALASGIPLERIIVDP